MEKKTNPEDDALREHSYDGIQEYDKRLPNWWLFTLYGAIVFSFCYWFYNHWIGVRSDSIENLQAELARIQTEKAANSLDTLSNEQLWVMAKDTAMIDAGSGVYVSTCASCHGPNLEGKIGPSLADNVWVHGGEPQNVIKTVSEGVLEKGMPAWGPVLGNKRVLEVVAFVMSKHEPTEATVDGTTAE